MKIKKITTDYKNKIFMEESEFCDYPNDSKYLPLNLVAVYPEYEYQKVTGFGAAFTDSAAQVFKKMSPQNQQLILKSYFDSKYGIGYNFGRCHINSCDFSTSSYCYIKDGDKDLETFSVERDTDAVIPMIQGALKYSDLKLFASPWSPPAFMKSNNDTLNGGKLLDEYKEAWAKYYGKFVECYKAHGIDIWAVTVQNEPVCKQPWESCQYTISEEVDFATNYLSKVLKPLGVKIICWDHNKHMLCEIADKAFSNPKSYDCIDGIACHWYTGDHFEQIRMVNQKYPDKMIIFSEGCKASSNRGIKPIDEQVEFAEGYAHEICGDFNAGLTAFTDWNIILDTNNGPFRNRTSDKYCDAPVICDTQNDKVIFGASFYYIGHFSRYIKKDAVIIGSSKYNDKIDILSAKNPDESVVCVVVNKSSDKLALNLKCQKCSTSHEIGAHTITTFVLKD